MDDLVYICTKIARQMDTNGLDRMFEAADAATAAIEEARPLLTKAQDLANEVIQLLTFCKLYHILDTNCWPHLERHWPSNTACWTPDTSLLTV